MESLNIIVNDVPVLTPVEPPAGDTETTEVATTGAVLLLHAARLDAMVTAMASARDDLKVVMRRFSRIGRVTYGTSLPTLPSYIGE
jgi:hypothetical protein